MNLRRRIKYYMVGAIIGLLLSFFIFNGRGCAWLPGARVLNSIQTSKVVISEKDNCLLKCNNISANKIYQLIENGNVDFKNSDTKNKNYIISYDSLTLSIQLKEIDTIAIINSIQNIPLSCKCNSKKEDNFVILYKPNSIVLEKLKSLTLSIKEETKCELDCFGISNNIIDSLFVNGTILFEASYPNRVPNAVYYIELKVNTVNYLFWIEQGATKTRLIHVVDYTQTNLKKGEPLNTLFQQSLKIKDCHCY